MPAGKSKAIGTLSKSKAASIKKTSSGKAAKSPAVKVATVAAPKTPVQPSYEAISALAYAIWERKGCPPGLSEQNWLEAEAELRGRAALGF